MKRAVIILVIVGMFGWVIYDLVIEPGNSSVSEEGPAEVDESIPVGLEKGNRAPDFELKTLDGETVKLSDFIGEQVFLNFWATWCPPCRAEMPDMQKFHEDKDVVILAVDLAETESSDKNVPEFIEEYGITFNVLIDEETEVANLYGIQPLPTSYLIDSTGVIHNKAIGALNYDMMVQEFEKMK